ncbi:MAG: ABC transporter ATP-binding protein [Acidimicrobiales bacterium]
MRVIARLVRLAPRTFAIAVAGAAVYAVATVGSSIVVGRVVDGVVLPRFEQGHVRSGAVVGAVVAIVGVGLLKATGIVTRRLFATITNANVGAALRRQVVERYQQVHYGYHEANATGELLSHASTDVEATSELLAVSPISTGVCVILLTSVVWLLLTDVVLAGVAFVLFPLLLVLNVRYQRAVEEPAEEAQARLGEVSAIAHESFEGALVVKALGAEIFESQRFRAAAAELRDAKILVNTTRAGFESLLDGLPGVGIACLLPLGALRVESGAITVGTVISVVSLFTLLVWPVRIIGYLLGEMPRAVVGYDRVERVLREPLDPRLAIADTDGGIVAGSAAGLEVSGVTYGYEPGRAVLRDVSFTVAPGRTLAIVGPTGAGKSTLAQLLVGLIDPNAGSVRIDGRDLSTLGVAELRATVAIAFQEAFLFGDSVAENILVGDDGDELRPAAALAGVAGFTDGLPERYDTVVGERGATLSGGQRQRVALARALARRPRLLVLDDATSAVDPTTETTILRQLREHLTATTTVVVASRPSTIALADEVVYLDEGRVVDQGTHAELLRRQPHYDELVHAYELDRADRGLR